MNKDEADTPWLRDMIDEDLQVLFADEPRALERSVRSLIAAAGDDEGVEGRVIELLETAIEHQNDDSSASVLAAIILGEIGSTRAISTLERALAMDGDEVLQDAARVALLRIGAPAIEAVMEAVEENSSPAFNESACELLGMVGALKDAGLTRKVMDFLEARVEIYRRQPGSERALESLLRASVHLGDRRQLPLMQQVLAEDYKGYNPAIQDLIEMLEENPQGLPIVGAVPPWVERYGWLFGDPREEARVHRRRPEGPIDVSAGESSGLDEGEESASMILWGLSATGDGGAGEDEGPERMSLDARRFLSRPGDDDEDERDEEDEESGEEES